MRGPQRAGMHVPLPPTACVCRSHPPAGEGYDFLRRTSWQYGHPSKMLKKRTPVTSHAGSGATRLAHARGLHGRQSGCGVIT